jgi:hypothetical protein
MAPSFFLPLWLLRATGGRKKEKEKEREWERESFVLHLMCTHSSIVWFVCVCVFFVTIFLLPPNCNHRFTND